MLSPTEQKQSAEGIIGREPSVRRSFLGLNSILWRIAIITGISQFSVSVWAWEFALFLEPILDPFRIGLTFSAGTFAALLGYPIAGAISDLFGRKNTLIASYIPQFIGLIILFTYPIWPLVPLAYGIHSFGWSFVIMISRAMPADEIVQLTDPNSSRLFTMVLLPSFLIDGISPIAAVMLLNLGLTVNILLLVGALTTFASMILSFIFVKETLKESIENTKKEPHIPLRQLGQSFWKFTVGMIGYTLAWGMTIPYYGILCVGEWGVSLEFYGLTWSAFSLATVLVMYSVSGFTGKHLKRVMTFGLLSNALIMISLGVGTGPWLLLLLNIIWAVPIIIWITAERMLSINGVPNEMKGRALGVYQLVMSITGLIAAPIGAWLWVLFGSQRVLWVISGILATAFTLVVWKTVPKVKSNQNLKKDITKKQLSQAISQ
ncbi:MAG: MFS transporter [Candidatus Thorarchaeota archaeon]